MSAESRLSEKDAKEAAAHDKKVLKGLEWKFPGSEFTGETFYKVYADLSKVGNNIIDFDIQNLQRVLFNTSSSDKAQDRQDDEGGGGVTQQQQWPSTRDSTVGSKGGGGKSTTTLTAQLLAQRIRAHYLDGSKLIKRCYGNKIDDDFQMYNWGMTLCADMSLPEDKAEFLINLYGKVLPKRISKVDFEFIIKKHTTYKNIEDPAFKQTKWLDLCASFKIHEVFMKGFAPSIGKRQLAVILKVNDIYFDINFPMITRDMAKIDKYCNKLHVTLVNDPCLSNEPDRFEKSILSRKVFEESIKEEEAESTQEVREKYEEKMRIEFEKEKILEHQRLLKRNKMAAERERVKQIDAKLKDEKLLRLAEIKRQREELEQCKIEIYLMSKEDELSYYCKKEWGDEYKSQKYINLQKLTEKKLAEKKKAAEIIESDMSKFIGEPKHAIAPLTDEERERQEILELMKTYRLSKEEDMKRNRMELQALIESSLSKGKFSASNLVGKEIELIRSELDADEEKGVSNNTGVKSHKNSLQEGSPLFIKNEKKISSRKLDPLEKFFINKNKESNSDGGKELDAFQISVQEFWANEEKERKNKHVNSGVICTDYDSPNDSPGEDILLDRLKGDWVSIDLDNNFEYLDRNKIEENRAKRLKEEEEKMASLVILEAKKRQKQMELEERKKAAAIEMDQAISEKEREKKERHERQLEYYRLQKLEQNARAELEAKEKKDREDETERKRQQKLHELKVFEEQLKQKKNEKAEKIAANLSNLKNSEEISRKQLLQELQKFGENAAAKDGKTKKSSDKLSKTDKDKDQKASPAKIEKESPEKKKKKNSKKSPKMSSSSGRSASESEDDATDASKIDSRPIEDVEVGGADAFSDNRIGVRSAGTMGLSSSSSSSMDVDSLAEYNAIVEASRGGSSGSEGSTMSRNSSPSHSKAGVVVGNKKDNSPGGRLIKKQLHNPRGILAADVTAADDDDDDGNNNNNNNNNIAASGADILNANFTHDRIKIKEYLHAEDDKGHFDGDSNFDNISVEPIYAGDMDLNLGDTFDLSQRDDDYELEYAAELVPRDDLAGMAAAEKEKQEKQAAFAAAEAAAEKAEKLKKEAEIPLTVDAAMKQLENLNIPDIEDDGEEADLESYQIISSRSCPLTADPFESTPSGETSFNNDIDDMMLHSVPRVDDALNISKDNDEIEDEQLEIQKAEDDNKEFVSIENIPSMRMVDIEMPSIVEHTEFTSLTFDDHSFVINKTEGELRLIIRHDDRGDFHGLFIHGFKPNSNAEKQDLLRIGDELLTINNVIVEGCHLEDVKLALLEHLGDKIPMTIRRRAGLHLESYFPSVVNLSSKIDSARSPRLFHIKEHQDVNLDIDRDTDEPVYPENSLLITIPISVPKTQGELRVIVRHDDKGDSEHGLYIHGFKPHSNAERQGKLKIGDELLVVNGKNVEGCFLEDVVDAMLSEEAKDPNSVDVIVKRRVSLEEFTTIMSSVLDPDAHEEHLEKAREAKYEPIDDHKLHEIEPFKVKKLNLESLTKELPIKSADELEEIPFEDIPVEIEKVDNELKVIVRHDDWGSIHGLFVHGFKPGGKADGPLQVGDEIISANKASLEQKFLEDLAVILKNHSGSKISLIVRRRAWSLLKNVPSSARNPFTYRSPMTPKFTVLKALENLKAFEIKEDSKHARRPSFAPSIEELHSVSYKTIEGDVEKTGGELRIHIRFDDEGTHHGLFIHGFKPNSNAEKQGLVRVGDEIIKINNKFVKGKFLEDVIAAMEGHVGSAVPIVAQRYDVHKLIPEYKIEPPKPKKSAAEKAAEKAAAEASAAEEAKKKEEAEKSAELAAMLADLDEVSVLSHGTTKINEDGSAPATDYGNPVGGGVEGQPVTDGSVATPILSQTPAVVMESVSLLDDGDSNGRDDDIADYGVEYVPAPSDEPKIIKKVFTEKDFDALMTQIEASLEGTLQIILDEELNEIFKKEFLEYVYQDKSVKVPKTNGELRIHVKHRKDESALVIHSFKPNSRAEKLGVVKVNDEIIEIEGELVMGYGIEKIVSIFKSHKGNTVNMVVRRKLPCVLYPLSEK